jgi:DNA-binding response OmpR family regulator
VDLILLAVKLPIQEGFWTLCKIRQASTNMPVVLLTEQD